MIVKTDIPNLLLAGVKKDFMKQLKMHEPDWAKVATKVSSTKSTEPYAWLGGTPDLKEWKDERVPEGLLENDFSIKNYDWEGTIGVDKNALADDQYGQVSIRVKELANKAIRFWGRLVYTLLGQGNLTTGTGLFAGKNITCYDGQPFFSAAHSTGSSGTQSNIATGTAFSEAAMRNAIVAMQSFVDDKGDYLDVVPDLLVVNPANQFLAREILNSSYYPTETTGTKLSANVMKGLVDLYVTPRVPTNFWALLDTKGIVKPIILQLRKDITFSTLSGNTQEDFMRKKIYFGVDWRGNAGFGMWQYAYGGSSDF
jgi:phage major head subunit gpT-like protein